MMPPVCKYLSITPPAAIIDNASATTASIDTKGFGAVTIIVYLGATDVAMTALSVGESDTDGSYSNITGLVWGTSTNLNGSTSALPTATDDNKFQIANIDLRGRKRYLDVTATIGNGTAGTYITILALLFYPEQSPNTIAEMGADEVLAVPTFA